MSVSIVVPQLGESVAEGTVSKWLKAVGDRVRKEEPLVEIQTDKINVEIPSPAEGVLEKIIVPEGTTVLVGTEIGVLGGAGACRQRGAQRQRLRPPWPRRPPHPHPPAAPARASATTPVAPQYAGAVAHGGNGSAALDSQRNLSPSVRKLMRDHNVDVAEVASLSGSGIAGRVTRDDLLDY